jgi:glycosyltransferase involved in cell wall biosynthesis
VTRPTDRYEVVRIDIDRIAAAVQRQQPSLGFALELFRGNEPVGFLLADLPGSGDAPAAQVEQWIAEPKETFVAFSPPPPASATIPRISIAICTKDNPSLLKRCLEGLDRLEPVDADIEILVIDNASESGAPRAVAEGHPRVRYVREEKLGLNFARNRALAEARHDILAFIDDDAVPDPRWLAGLLQAWRRAPDAGAYTGQVFALEIETKAQIIVEQMGGFRKGFVPVTYGLEPSADPLFPVTTVFGNGCNMAYNVATMRSLGGFDTALDMGRYLPGGGDLDGLYRVVRAGHKLVYEPAMLVRHQHRRDMAALRRQIRKSWGAGTMAFLTKIRDHDPEMASKADQFIQWWMGNLMKRLLSGHNRPDSPWLLSLQEWIGAREGLKGLYQRARHRADAIERGIAGNG